MQKKFSKSNSLFTKTVSMIPLASQTFSKSHIQYVRGASPLFLTRGKGCRVWDVDGNEYIDMINGLLAVSLGYCYKPVDDAIKKQLSSGISFSLPSVLEGELAALLIKHIPSAEMVRFGKNGSDVTSGAIRIARAVTGRDDVAVCGYHGWHDWYIGSTARRKGVPMATVRQTHRFEYNNIESLANVFKKNKGKIAAVIMEPMSYIEPAPGFLKKVAALTRKNGALFIFDEVITGFRFSLGGAQKYFGVTPDLSCFGKSMANGMPISVLAGKRKYMKVIDDIFYSFTFGGEALSIAAAIATIKEMERKRVPQALAKTGTYLKQETNRCIKRYSLEEIIEVKGAPHWQVVTFSATAGFTPLELKSFVQQEMIARGILWYGQHNISFSHTRRDIDKVIKAYDGAFSSLAEVLAKKTLRRMLKGEPIQDIFKVR